MILGLSGRLLAAGPGASPQARDVERIRANAYGLLRHVEELLEAARIDSGALVLRRAPCDVATLVRDAASGFAGLLEERDARLVVHAHGRLVARVDEVRLGAVLTTCCQRGALRAARRGRALHPVGRGRPLRIEVADSGPGVPLAERHAIFQRFQQVDGPAHQRAGGTGLGLAIVRDLVDLHGATVAAGVAPEGGALFVVELPLDAAPDDEPAAPAPGPEPAERERATVEARCRRSCAPPTGGTAGRRRPSPAATCRVLLVATSDVLGLYLEELLADDLEVLHAATAAEALAVARGGRIDAAVVDAGGPGGEAVLAALRADADPPVVVLAAEARHARRLVQDEAADDYAVQPFASEELLVRLGRARGPGARSRPARVPTRASGPSSSRCRRRWPWRPRTAACSRPTMRWRRCSAFPPRRCVG